VRSLIAVIATLNQQVSRVSCRRHQSESCVI